MAVFGIDFYGLSRYGTDQVVDYAVDPFVAVTWNYDQVKLSWQNPTGSWDKFRLVKNRRGYPVTESDGEILIDSDGPPGVTETLDIQPVPGRFVYYGIYLRTQTDPEEVWTRASVASCLANEDWGSAEWMWDRLPEYYKYISNGELTTDQVGNSYLWQFIQVFGWGLDLLKTQSDMAKHMNDPLRVHVSDLEELSAELGVPFDPEIRGMTMRQRISNAAHVDREKGTLAGWRNEINIMTGWDVDVQIGDNLMLDDDQSNFSHPQFPDWSPYINYAAGEIVKYSNKIYRANVGGSYKDVPPGTTWTKITDEDDDGLLNPLSGGMSTWEGLSFTSGVESPAISNRLGIGMTFPANSDVQNHNMLFVKNSTSQTVSAGIRSVARPLEQAATLTAAISASATSITLSAAEAVFTAVPFYAWLDWGTPNQECVQVTARSGSPTGTTLTIVRGQQLTTAVAHAAGAGYWHKGSPTAPLDPEQPILDGVPVPWVKDYQKWQEDVEYATNDVVLYAGRPYVALRASTGVTPPYPAWSTSSGSWAALGSDRRVGMMLSGYTHQPPSLPTYNSETSTWVTQNFPANVTPFVEWYDRDGVAIGKRLFAASPYVEGNPSVRVASTSDASVAGATFTAGGTDIGKLGTSTPGALVIDGVSVTNQDLVLVTNRSTASQNGVYRVGNPGNSTEGWGMVRHLTNYDTIASYPAGLVIHVAQGTSNGGKYFALQGAPTVLNTSSLNFTAITSPWYEPNVFFDSFSDEWSDAPIVTGGQNLDTGNGSWNKVTGDWIVDGFLDGTMFPANPSVRSIATVDGGQANCQVGVTFKTAANEGTDQGLILRYVSNTSYLKATRTGLYLANGTELGSYGPAEDGDRLVVSMNGNVYTVYLYNGSDTQHTPVLTYTDTANTNLNSTIHGVIVE